MLASNIIVIHQPFLVSRGFVAGVKPTKALAYSPRKTELSSSNSEEDNSVLGNPGLIS
jgi:hypothetical protein